MYNINAIKKSQLQLERVGDGYKEQKKLRKEECQKRNRTMML